MNIEKDILKILSTRTRPDKSIILDSKERTIIYGAGGTGRQVLALLKKHGVRVGCFLDEKGGGNTSIDGVPVLKPDDPAADKTSKVIVALFNHRTDIMPVLSFLKKRGFANVVPYTELFIHFADELPAQYWLGPADVYETHVRDMTNALAMFQDEPSRDLYMAFLRFRITGDPACMPQPDRENIYFPQGVTGVRKPNRFIDCGAFDGDTLLSVRERFGVLESIRAFEPDPENFRKLAVLNTWARTLRRPFSKDTVLSPCGVWSSTVQLRFASDGSLASGVSEHGGSMVQCVALDQCLDGYAPTLLKMDIEGGEIEALNGCKRMIASVKPDLAVSVYHALDHLWKIPLLISELDPGYRCYLRSHGANGYDTVFYAYQRR